MKISKKFLLQQKPMLRFVGQTFIQTVLPFLKTNYKGKLGVEKRFVKPPTKELIKAYSEWSGVSENRYNDIPTHMFSQYALAFGLGVQKKLNYPLDKIINQGVEIKSNGDISSDDKIRLTTEVISVKEEEGKARVHQRMFIGNDTKEDVIEVNLYTAFLLKRIKKKKVERSEPDMDNFKLISTWSVEENAGLQFGILTGDLNPLHWVKFIGKATPFKGIILHGFGMYSKVYEIIQNSLGDRLKEMNVRFIKPVLLPSKGLEVYISKEKNDEGRKDLLLKDENGKILMIGNFLN